MNEIKYTMNVKEIAEYLNISITSIYRYTKMGKIPAFRIGKMWRFKKEKIDQWTERHEIKDQNKVYTEGKQR
jgi:excisionase family DNA binding protein